MEDWQLRPARDLALSGMARYRSVQRESGLVESGLRLLWWGGVRLGLRLWHGLQVHGSENLPDPGPPAGAGRRVPAPPRPGPP